MIGIALKNRQDESKALETAEFKHSVNLRRHFRQSAICCVARTTICGGSPGCNQPHRGLDDHPPRPRPRPFLKDRIARNAIIQTGNKQLLGFLWISRQHERQGVKARHVFFENPAKIRAGCIRCGPFIRTMLCSCHGYLRHPIGTSLLLSNSGSKRLSGWCGTCAQVL